MPAQILGADADALTLKATLGDSAMLEPTGQAIAAASRLGHATAATSAMLAVGTVARGTVAGGAGGGGGRRGRPMPIAQR